jgi:Bacteriophage minor capsid protein
MAMVDEIADYLAANGFGTVGTNIFTFHMPTTPDVCLSVHQFAMGPPIITMDRTVKSEQVGLQIQSRALTDQAAETNLYAVFAALAAIANVTIGSTRYQGITGKRSPEQLKIDQDNRVVFYCEFTVLKALS